jgi:hypothetical protein
MATNWFDPTGSNSGFYNSPQDFLFKSQGGTWYGQGASGQAEASKMPTMGDYYFGGGGQQPAAPQAQPMNPVYGGPTQPQGYNAPQGGRVAPGGSMDLGNNVNVPTGPLWNRYQAVQANPAMIEADPAYRYMLQQGEEALGRSAGARRKRFAGGTMLDFQKHAQGQAANYMRTMLPELRAGAGQEYEINRNNIMGQRSEASMKAMQGDPYGRARQTASRFKTLGEYQSSPEYAAQARAGRGDQAVMEWMRGQEMNRSIFGG